MPLARNSDLTLARPAEPSGRLAALATWVMLTHGWRRFLIAVVSGALGALAMPPFGFFPALVLSLTAAVWLIDGIGRHRRSLLRAAWIGWAWGFGYMTAGLWWLGAAFLVEADQFAWAMPLGVVGLPAVLAIFYAAGFAAAHLLWSPGATRLLALAVGLAAAEWLRGHLFTGFPWNTLGMAFGSNLWLMQPAALVGLYGLTLLVVPIAASPAVLATGTSRNCFVAPLASAVTLALLAGYGAWRVPSTPDPSVPGVRLRMIQPSILQDAKFRPENRDGVVDKYLELSARGGPSGITHLIWPESAFPFLLQRDPETLKRIGDAVPLGQHLLTGAARAQEPLTREHRVFHNSILTIDPGGDLRETYDKVHLVPFGEYLPGPFDTTLRAIGLRQFVSVPGGFTPGSREGQRILSVAGLPPIAATICYESIFPGAIVPADPKDGAHQEPGLILNLTNDAWFGDTPGPRQHFAQARLRAVEEGLPLVRDANSGITAVVDAHGRITAALPLGAEDVLDADLPEALPGRTLYARLGDLPFSVLLALTLIGALAVRFRRAGASA